MRTENNNQPQNNDDLWTYGIIAAGATIGVLAGAAYLATFLTSFQSPGIPFGDVVSSVIRLPVHMGAPAEAFPEPARSRLPGPIGYWTIHGVALLLLAIIAVKVMLWLSTRGPGLDKRTRLGVNAQPRIATPAELKSERITEPTHGRFVYGRTGRHLLATHHHDTTGKVRKVPGALGLIGPSRSGKSLTAINGIGMYPGPAIIVSVKTDLIEPTLEDRRRRGEVRIYDPTGLTPMTSACWSPLRGAETFVGAQRSAARLLSAIPSGSSGPGVFWSNSGESFLAALLWLAANTAELTIKDAARWVTGLDKPTTDDPGKAAVYLRALAAEEGLDPELVTDVAVTLQGVWKSTDKIGDSFYVAARQAVRPWTRDDVRAVSMTTNIDLEWLMSGNNTLYLAAPLMDQPILAPAFGTLVADLVDQVILRHDEQRRPLDRELLLLLDETANTPLAQLPSWTSTVAGYGIQLVTVWQSMSQIESAYGQGEANTIVANHNTLLFFPRIKDDVTTSYVGRILGTEHQPGYVNGSSFGSLGGRDRESATAVSLIPPHVLRQMGDEDRLLITGNKPPAQIKAVIKVPRKWRAAERGVES